MNRIKTSILNLGVGLLLFLSQKISGQTLEQFKNEAERNNPEIKSAKISIVLAEEKINEAGALPETNFSIGYFVSEPETRTGPQTAKFSASQKLPWFGSIKARQEVIRTSINVNKNRLDIAKRKIFLKVEKRYYQLYSHKAKIKVINEQLKLLDTYKEIVLSKLANNQASAVDILKINIAKNNLKKTEEVVRGELLTIEGEMNQLLHRDGFDPLVIPDNLYIPEEEPTLMVDDIIYHPELLLYDFMQEVVDKKKTVNTKDALPAIGLGVDYVIVSERTDIDLPENGKDIIMPMVSFAIPILTKKHKSIAKQHNLEIENLTYKREAAQNKLEEVLERTINNRITARIDYDTQLENKNQAERAEDVLRTAYETGEVDFIELLEVQQILLDIEINKIEAVKTYFIQTAVLNYLR